MTSNGHCPLPLRDYLGPFSVSAGGHGRFLWEPGSRAGREVRKNGNALPTDERGWAQRGGRLREGRDAAATFGLGERRGV